MHVHVHHEPHFQFAYVVPYLYMYVHVAQSSLQNEELQRNNWKLTDENQRLSVRLMDDDRSSLVSRRPGDGGSEEHSARSSLAGELPFQRQSAMRQTYHGPGIDHQLCVKIIVADTCNFK